jgi:hypothetical protein
MAPDSPVATRIWLGARLIAMMKLATVARLREGDSNPCPLQYNLVLLPLLEEPASHTPLACWTPRYYTEPAHASPPHLLRWAAQSEAVGHWASLCLSSTDSDITHQIARIQCELPYFMHGLDMSADLPGKLLVGFCRCFLHARRSAPHQSPPHSRAAHGLEGRSFGPIAYHSDCEFAKRDTFNCKGDAAWQKLSALPSARFRPRRSLLPVLVSVTRLPCALIDAGPALTPRRPHLKLCDLSHRSAIP